jgi:hypothetical protein
MARRVDILIGYYLLDNTDERYSAPLLSKPQ